MDNKVKAEMQFCSDENINYLFKQMNWNNSINDLKSTVVAFVNNYKGHISQFEDYWESVRHLNREFINSVESNPNTKTMYSTPCEYVLHNEEIYP